MIKLLIGGSPCTHWSVAQTKNRETQPNSGLGWELFLNYKIAFEKCNYCTYNGQRGCRNILTQKVIDIARGKTNGEIH